jgi:hypothetical protein
MLVVKFHANCSRYLNAPALIEHFMFQRGPPALKVGTPTAEPLPLYSGAVAHDL